MNTFYHREDGGVVLLDISDNILFLSTFGVSRGTLRIGTGNISIKDSKSYKSRFYCLECRKEVSLVDIFARCYYCGEEFPLSELYRVSDSGGPYCITCSRDKFSGVSKTKLTTIFCKLSFNRI